MHELLEVVARELTDVGANASVHVGMFPADDGESVYVVVPHEYFVLTATGDHPTRAQLRRTVAFCVEHPGNATFETGARWASAAGSAFDINRDSTQELNRRGVRTQRFVLGYSPLWDQWHGTDTSSRGVDITYLGTTDVRRDYLLALQAEELSQWRTALLIPPHEQMTKPRPDFLMGSDKHRHLANSRILLNLHRGASRSLEWVRVLEAMCNGCAVVSERSVDFEPLVPGVHIAFSDGDVAAGICSALLRNPGRLDEIRDSAYAVCRQELSMRGSVHALMEEAERLAGKRRQARNMTVTSVGYTTNQPPTMPEPPPPDPAMPRLSDWAGPLPETARRTMRDLVSESLDLLKFEVNEVLGGRAKGGEAAVDVVISGNGNIADLAVTCRSLAVQDVAIKVLVAEPVDVLEGVGRPRGRMLNALIEKAGAPVLLIVDPGQELLPGALSKLLDALNRDPALSAVYAMAADTRSGYLWNSLPPEWERLRRRVYLGAPILIRRAAMEAIGGYREDPELLGFEDHELWLRLLSRGHAGALVPQILVRGARTTPPAFSVSGLTPEVTTSLLAPN